MKKYRQESKLDLNKHESNVIEYQVIDDLRGLYQRY